MSLTYCVIQVWKTVGFRCVVFQLSEIYPESKSSKTMAAISLFLFLALSIITSEITTVTSTVTSSLGLKSAPANCSFHCASQVSSLILQYSNFYFIWLKLWIYNKNGNGWIKVKWLKEALGWLSIEERSVREEGEGEGEGGRGRRKGKDVVSSFLLSFYVGKSEKGTTDGPPFMLISGFSLFFPMLFYFGIPN